MKFYVIENTERGETVGCELTRAAADKVAAERCADFGDTYRIECIEVEVTPESIRRMLGQIGGYAKDMKTVKETVRTEHEFSVSNIKGGR